MAITSYELARHQHAPTDAVREQWTALGHFEATRWVLCAWEDRHALVSELGAYSSGGGQWWPYGTTMLARLAAATCYGYGRSSYTVEGLAEYEWALIELFYSTFEVPYDAVAPYLLSESIDSFTEHLIYEKDEDRGWTWTDSGGPVNQAVGIASFGLRYLLTLYDLAEPPSAAAAYLGYCNASAWSTATLGLVFQAQTLLLADVRIDRTVRLATLPKYTMTYVFWFRPNGWNKFWNSETGAWETITSGGAQLVPYPTVDFTLLMPS